MNETGPNLLDYILLAVMAVFTLRALLRGFVLELMGLITLVAALVLSSVFVQPVAGFLARAAGSQSSWWGLAAFILILAVVLMAGSFVGGAISRIINKGPFSGLDRLAGAGVGLAKGVLLSYLLVNIMLLVIFINPAMKQNLAQSMVAPYVVKGGRYMMDLIPSDFTKKLQEQSGLLQGRTDAPKNHESKQK